MPQRREDSRSAAAQAAPSIQEDDPIMLPFINVYDLGAVGNGRADDTEAFKKALSIAEKTGQTIDLAPETFRVGEL